MEKFNALDINTRQLAFEETAARKSLRSTHTYDLNDLTQ